MKNISPELLDKAREKEKVNILGRIAAGKSVSARERVLIGLTDVASDGRTAEELREELQFVSRQEVAELLDVSAPRVSHLVTEGILSQDERGRLERRKTMHALFSWFRNRMGEGKTSAAQAKAEGRLLENELLRLAVEKAKGGAIPAAQVDKAWEHIILLLRQKLLGIPNKIAPRMPYLKNESEIESAILAEIEDALLELSRPIDYQPEIAEV
jgi:phage terminase Nu1 subunit (DNA packaging protein)